MARSMHLRKNNFPNFAISLDSHVFWLCCFYNMWRMFASPSCVHCHKEIFFPFITFCQAVPVETPWILHALSKPKAWITSRLAMTSHKANQPNS